MTTATPPSAPSPLREAFPRSVYANYVPHDLEYSASFEDSLITAVLDPPAAPDKQEGIRVISDDSGEEAVEGESVRFSAISTHTLPNIPETSLPLPLDDVRRIFTSPVPGVKLTHPYGYLEGGPYLDPEMDTFPEHFLQEHGHITTPQELRSEVDKAIEEELGVFRERLEKRREAKEKNEGVERELRALGEEHGMELRVYNRLAEEQGRKREARERRRREREGG